MDFAIIDATDPSAATRLKDRLKAMAHRPYDANGLVKVADGLYRMKQGDWRALILISDEQRVVMVDRVVRRNEATYK